MSKGDVTVVRDNGKLICYFADEENVDVLVTKSNTAVSSVFLLSSKLIGVEFTKGL